jgi:hypothetical protein
MYLNDINKIKALLDLIFKKYVFADKGTNCKLQRHNIIALEHSRFKQRKEIQLEK